MKKLLIYGAKGKKSAIEGLANDISKLYHSPLYQVKPNLKDYTVDVYDRNGDRILIIYPKISEEYEVTRYKFRPATNEEIENQSKTLYVKDTTKGKTSDMLKEVAKISSVSSEIS